MKLLNVRLHGICDFAAVVFFALSPLLFGLGGTLVATAAYGLAAIHLLLTLITRAPFGLVKVVPFFVHGLVELVVGIVLLLLPTLIGAAPGSPAKRFYPVAGAVVLVVWVLTDYGRKTEIPEPKA